MSCIHIYIYLLIFQSISWPTWESNHLSIMPSQLKKSERSDSVFKTTLKKVSNRWKTSWIMQIWDKHCFLVLSSICSDKFSVVWYQCWKDPARNLVVLKLEGTLIIYSPSFFGLIPWKPIGQEKCSTHFHMLTSDITAGMIYCVEKKTGSSNADE